MPDFCSLCGTKLSFFGSHALVCANQDEMFCSKCHDELYHMDNLERGRYVLEHGKPDHPEKMQEFITIYEERAKQKLTFEPPTRVCPACGGEMKLALKNFRIGADGQGGLSTLFAEQYEVDLFACPECGKVELYTANFASIKARQARQEAEKAAAETAKAEQQKTVVEREYTSYRPGRKPGEKPPWEK